jgi:hypothetical protein
VPKKRSKWGEHQHFFFRDLRENSAPWVRDEWPRLLRASGDRGPFEHQDNGVATQVGATHRQNQQHRSENVEVI